MGGKSGGRKQGSPSDKGKSARPEVSGMNRQAFDAWLDRQLRDMYESAVSEPVPDELLSLLTKREPGQS